MHFNVVLISLAFSLSVVWASIAAADDRHHPESNLVVDENRLPGATDWQLTRVRADGGGYRSPWIEGYCSRQSVEAGENIDIMVSTEPPQPFQIEIFRMGYYGGRGARLMTTIGPLQGMAQPTPQPGEKNLHECGWETSTQLTIPAEWLSGVYLGRLTTLPGDAEPYWQSYVVFIVRDSRPADILFQCSDNTWQAYNRWPDNFSIYTHPDGNQGPWADVSFDRPYGREAQYTSVVNDPLTVGSGEFLPFEFPLAYWLEQHGYDVTYCSNSDMLTPDRGLKCDAFISVGHDEYWDIRQFRSVETMRDNGVSLLFLSGNSVCWVTPFRESSADVANRIIFRGGPFGADNDYAVNRERDNGPFPHRGPDEGLLMGARNVEPVNGGVTGSSSGRITGSSTKPASRRETAFQASSVGNIMANRLTSPVWRWWPKARPGRAASIRSAGPQRSTRARKGISSSTPRRFSGCRDSVRHPATHSRGHIGVVLMGRTSASNGSLTICSKGHCITGIRIQRIAEVRSKLSSRPVAVRHTTSAIPQSVLTPLQAVALQDPWFR